MKEKKTYSTNKVNGEDATQYGEFISSFHEWITPEEQKIKANKLEKVTKKDNEK